MPLTSITLPKEALKDLKCHYCRCYLSCAPIHCSSTGEGICGRCIPNDDVDAIFRNVIYEKAMVSVLFPCIHDEYGCEELLLFNQGVEHEKTCPYKLVKCPHVNCDWEGSYNKINEHFKTHDLPLLDDDKLEINIKQNEKGIVFTIESDVLVLIKYEYASAEEILFLDVAHFSLERVQMSCKLILIGNNNDELFISLKPFNCVPYVLNYEDNLTQKISFSCYSPALQKPDIVYVKVSFKTNIMSCSSMDSLQKIACSKCRIFMVPPIVIHDNEHYCVYCNSVGEFDKKMEEYARKIRYPCLWKLCSYIGKFDDIRSHELKCKFAEMKCCLDCEETFNFNSLMQHLMDDHEVKKYEQKIIFDISNTTELTSCYYYNLYDDQMMVVEMYYSNETINIKFYNLLNNDDRYTCRYYFIHSHCKLTSKPSVTGKLLPGKLFSAVIEAKPNCFGNSFESLSFVCYDIQKLSAE